MDQNQKNLKSFVNSKSQFLTIKDGGEQTVKYLSANPGRTYFQGKTTECIRFIFEIDSKPMFWDRTSRELAVQMSEFLPGDMLSIKVTGQKNKTKYFIKKVG